MSQHKDNLKLALELSHEIVRLAQEKAWPEMEQLDRQRLKLLESYFLTSDSKNNDSDGAESIQSILDLNNRALEICAKARGALMEDGKKVRLGREAITAYQKQSFD
ncbi:MAG: flagellar protein FliT [Candidatus Thiodiazotropha sp. (ex. Lucinoma kazani)]